MTAPSHPYTARSRILRHIISSRAGERLAGRFSQLHFNHTFLFASVHVRNCVQWRRTGSDAGQEHFKVDLVKHSKEPYIRVAKTIAIVSLIRVPLQSSQCQGTFRSQCEQSYYQRKTKIIHLLRLPALLTLQL